MKSLYLILIILALIVGCNKSTAPDENYDYHWKLSDSPVHIDSCFVVNVDEVLKIDAGVEVIFKASEVNTDFNLDSLNVGMLLIKGTIKATGTKANPILFKKEDQNGHWGNIVLENSVSDNVLRYCEIANFLSTKKEDLIYPGGISFYFSNGLLENCFFYAIGPQIALSCNNSSPQLRNNKIALWGKEDIEKPVSYYGTGIDCRYNSAPFIYNTVINGGSYSVRCIEGSSPKILNSTFYVNSLGNCCVKSESNSFPEVTNTILFTYPWGSTDCASSSANSSVLISYSVLSQQDHPDDYTDNGNNIFTSEIGFIEDRYYELSSNSPCIDSGTNDVEGLTNTDIDGNRRIVGRKIDIGAFEYQGY